MKLGGITRTSAFALLAAMMPLATLHAADRGEKFAGDPTALDSRGEVSLSSLPQGPAAASGYAFSQYVGTYAEVGAGATSHLSGNVDDSKAEGISIGFPFSYNGSTFTQFSVCANGHLALGATMDCTYSRLPISSAAASNNNLSALGFDLRGLATGSVSSELTGSSPNQVLTVQWKDFAAFYSGSSTENYNFQIKLHEGSNQIEFVYGSFVKNATARAPQVGIRGASNADFSNRTTTTDWSASTAGAANTATMALSTTVLPVSGLTFAFTPPNFPPTIAYTALGNTLSTANRSLAGVAITDDDGVNTTPGTAPRLYFKRGSDADAWNDNTSASDGWKYVEASGAASPFDFTIDYSLLNGGTGVSAGDTVQYFVVAQDLASTPVVGINNGSFAAAPASVALDASAFPIGGSINSYRISELMTGTYQVPGSYPSLTNAGGIFEALNGNVLAGDVVIEIADDLMAETGAIALNEAAEQPAGSNFTITIRPTGAARTISGASAASTGLITLNGADRVTIDGSLSGGNDQSLTITNLAASGVGIWIRSAAAGNGATDNTIENCLISGAAGSSTIAGILSSGTTFGGDAEAANSGNSIRNNLITKVQNALYLRGGPTTLDDGWIISGNTLGSTVAADKLGFRGMLIGNAQNFVVANNTIQGVTTAGTSTSSGMQVALEVSGGHVLSNRISDIKNTNTGGYGSNGLYIGASSAVSNLVVANNFITDVASYGYSGGAGAADNGYGIMVAAGGGFSLYYNSVLLATDQTNGGLPAAINIAVAVAAGSLDLRNNIFATTQTTGTRYAIYSSAANSVFSTINHNDYFAGTGSVGFLGAAQATLGDWQVATGQDANSISADPLFVSTTDLHLSAAASPAVDAGTPIALIFSDIDGGARSATTPDMGADEFGVVMPVVTSSVGVGNGAISPLGTSSISAGGLLGFDLIPDPGYEVDNVGGTCPGSLSGNYFTAGPIMGDCTVIANFKPVAAGSTHVRISQAYGGGGGAGYYLYDYVELFNPGTSAVSLDGHSLQYGSATGQFGSNTNNIYAFPAGTSIGPGKYLLVQLSSAGSSGLALPTTPDLTTTNLTMSGASGKVALANVAVALGCGATATPCALPHANIVDLAAWGTSNNAEGGASINNGAGLTNQQGGVRKVAGCQDTDNNNADFDVLSGAALVPRNAASPANTCGGPVTHVVTPSVGTPSGSISPSAAQTVNDGDTTSFTLTADAGYEIDNVGGTCGGTLDGGTGVFTTAAITADCTVIANFKVIGASGPVAAITPASLSISATWGGSAGTAPLTVGNTGDAALTYSITESFARPLPVVSPEELALRGARGTAGSAGGTAPRANPAPLAVVVDEGFDDITTLAGAGWLMGNNSQPVGSTGWFQGNDTVFAAFDGAATAYIGANFNNAAAGGNINNWLVSPPITFNPGSSVSFYTRAPDGTQWADRLEVRLCTSGACTNFGSTDTDVGDFTTLLLSVNETLDPTGYPTVWTQYTVNAGLPTSGTGRIAFRYFVPDSNTNSNFIGIDRLVIDNGTPTPTGCTNPNDVPWLSASPLSGTVAASNSDTVTVTGDPTGLAVGSYTANVCVATNDPAAPMTTVPVTLTVAAGVNHTVTPSVVAGSGSISPNTPQTVPAGTTTSFTLTPDAGYQIGSVGGSCGGSISGNTYTTAPVSADCTVEVTFTVLPFPAPYCNVAFSSAVEPISRVVLTGIDNPSDPMVNGSPALENFLAVTGGVVSLGGLYDIAVEGNTDGNYTTKVRAYIDWNQNGSFADAGEMYNLSDLVNSTGADGKQATGSILVPASATLGLTRMRVIKRFSTAADPCNTTGYGQAEDYTIEVNNDPLPLPEAQVSPLSLSLSAQVGASDTDTLTVSNVGPGRLTFNITRALPDAQGTPDAMRNGSGVRTTAASQAARAAKLASTLPFADQDDLIGAYARDGGLPQVGNAILANDPLCEVGTPGLVVHDGNGAPDNGYGWNPSAGTDAKIVDKFTPTAYPANYTTVCVTLLTNAGLTSAPVSVVVYADDGAGGAPGTELGRVNATANNISSALAQSFQAIDISSMGLNIASGSVYIGLEWNASTISGLYLASDETTAVNAGGYSYSGGAWGATVDGFPDYKSMFIRAIEVAAGPPGTGCGSPSSIPWLSVSPMSGAINGPGSVAVTVTANAASLAAGTHEALLCVNTNDPGAPQFEIPVTFTVTPLPDAIFSDGFEGDDLPGDPNIVTGVINMPLVQDGDGSTFDFETALFGTYDAGRADDINIYDFGSGMYVYWYGDVSTLSVGGVTDASGTEFAVLHSGDVVGPSSTISASSIAMTNWLAGSDGYIGVAFENTTTGQLNYGYIRMVTGSTSGYPAQWIEYGYNKAGNPITIP